MEVMCLVLWFVAGGSRVRVLYFWMPSDKSHMTSEHIIVYCVVP